MMDIWKEVRKLYFGEKEFLALKDTRIWNAYQENALSIYVEDGIWWYEKCPDLFLDRIVRVCMLRTFPHLEYIEDIIAKRRWAAKGKESEREWNSQQ